MGLLPPINFPKWISENAHLLKPPVSNFCLYNSDYSIMVVGGPNARTDYHVNQTEEWFFQQKGDMLLKVVDDGEFKDVWIREGDMFLLPGNVPHNPVRYENTIGIVVERKRPEGVLGKHRNCKRERKLNQTDELRWYCSQCAGEGAQQIVHSETFYCTDLGSQLKPPNDNGKPKTDAGGRASPDFRHECARRARAVPEAAAAVRESGADRVQEPAAGAALQDPAV
ncbi:3-hydroxyanthranilic acid dioxygenase [Nowakowskiella sp. JEL0078]|nr:3-hydroxyanthranilic acid dioxygenase [Nowakowskiella sp. JEL0078]